MINQEVFGIFLNQNEKKAIIISIKGYKLSIKEESYFQKKGLGINLVQKKYKISQSNSKSY